MANMEQKVVADQTGKPAVKYDNENNNLGLDADQSSEFDNGRKNYNNDNDRVSHNPDGEDDDRDTTEESGSSPLMDK
jgi:hypothetical protein